MTQDNLKFLLEEKEITDIQESEESSGDQFDHVAHVETLKKVINKAPGSWNIGLFGPWGAGKSTIVNILYNQIREEYWSNFNSPNNCGNPKSQDRSESSQDFPVANEGEIACVSIDAWQFDNDTPRSDLVLEFNQELLNEACNRFDTGLIADYLSLKRAGEYSSSEDISFTKIRNQTDFTDLEDRISSDQLKNRGVIDEDRILEILYDTKPQTRNEYRSIRTALSEIDPILVFLFASVFILAIISGFTLEFIISYLGFNTEGELIGLLGTVFVGLAFVFSIVAKMIIPNALSEFLDNRTEITKVMKNPRHEWPGIYEELYDEIVHDTQTMWEELSLAEQIPDESNDPQRSIYADGAGSGHDALDQIVVTIDDLDRCESSTAYQLLIAIKSFLGNEQCKYIIPCDEDALYNHLEGVDPSEYLGDSKNQQSFLSKFFDTEIEVPEPNVEEIENYFDRKTAKVDTEISDSVRGILLAADLKTPRQVIQAINRFVVLHEVAVNRDVIDPQDHNEDNEAFLAIISVLQEDYPNLYAALERDPGLMDQIWEEWANHTDVEGEDPLLTKFGIPEDRQSSLISFLSRTRKYDIDNRAAFFRLSSREQPKIEVFRSRFKREDYSGLLESYQEIVDGEELNSKLKEKYKQVVKENIQNGERRGNAIRTTFELIRRIDEKRTSTDESNEMWELFRDEISTQLVSVISETEMENILAGENLVLLEPFITSIDGESIKIVYKEYVGAVVGNDGLRRRNFDSLIEKDEDEFTGYISDKLTDELINGYQEGQLGRSEFCKTVNQLSSQSRELTTHELIKYKQRI